MFKKKSLKFTYDKVSRDMRHAEALKARESSRFKRLSMIRSLNSDLDEKSIDMSKENESKDVVLEPENKTGLHRLEMLFKWKQEKQLKKEMEKQSKKKPFYVGGNKKDPQNFQSSFIAQPNSSFNSSKLIKSRLFAPSTSLEKNKALSTKQESNAMVQSSRIQISKQGAPSITVQSSRIPNSKQTSCLPKSGSTLSRNNSAAAHSRKIPGPTSTIDKTNTLSKWGSTLSNNNSTSARKFLGPASTSDKIGLPKPQNTLSKGSAAIQRKLPVSVTTADKTASASKLVNNIQRPVNKTPNIVFSGKSKDISKPANKPGTGLPKLTSHVTAASKKIPVQQSKMPVPSINKKFGSNSKLSQKETLQSKENTYLRKGYNFKTAMKNSSCQRTEILQKTPVKGIPKILQEKTGKNIKEKSSKGEQSHNSIPDVTFNSDISIIKPARTSFAPNNFTFQPPEGLSDFDFDDEDFNIFEDLEKLKVYLSRTSTPSKDSGRKSSNLISKEFVESNKLMADAEKTSDITNSNDIHISELMTPEPSQVKINNEQTDENINKQACNAESCEKITDIENKNECIAVNQQPCEEFVSVSHIKAEVIDADIAVNQQPCSDVVSLSTTKTAVKDTDMDLNQQACKEIASVSCIKAEVEETDENVNKQAYNTESCEIIIDIENKNEYIAVSQQPCEELVSVTYIKAEDNNTDIAVNQQTGEEAVCVSATKTVVKDTDLNQQTCEEIASDINIDPKETKNVDNGLVKCLFPEKQLFSDFIENVQEDAVVVSQNVITKESRFNHSLKNRAFQNMPEREAFPDDDDDFNLDSIDLNKMMIKSDDESDDDVLSPQILKCPEKKANGTLPKRVSMLKRLAVMNSISETDELISVNSAKSSNTRNTPRRCKGRRSTTLNDSPVKNQVDSPKTAVTPRRSLRLLKQPADSENIVASPFEVKKTNNEKLRRSMRLIDLNTPEKAFSEKLCGENSENMDPDKLLIDLESPTVPTKSKKVSLLYSPEKRKSIRKSIRGDLMAFSPM